MKTRERATDAEGDRVTADKLMADLRVLVADMDQLLRATAGQTGQHIAQVRANAEQSLQAARARVADLQDAGLAKTRAAGRATDEYVHANPWQVMSVCAVAGFLLGVALMRGGASDS